MSEEEKYTLEMNRKEIDELIQYLEHYPDINIIRRLNLARTPSISTSGKLEDVSVTTTTKIKVRRLNDSQVGFNCYKCGRLHIHGWPKGEDRSGYRQSHCEYYPDGYYIEM